MRPRIVPDVVAPREPVSLPPSASVAEAARLMADHRIAALLVGENGSMTGIFTERDVTVRVVAAGLDPAATPLSRVMTVDPVFLAPDDSVAEALALMRRNGFRHLPVLDAGKPVAMVSVRDLYAAVQDQLETDILNRDAWIFGLGDAWNGGGEDGLSDGG